MSNKTKELLLYTIKLLCYLVITYLFSLNPLVEDSSLYTCISFTTLIIIDRYYNIIARGGSA